MKSLKSQKTPLLKRLYLTTVILAVVGLVGASAYAYMQKTGPFTKEEVSEANSKKTNSQPDSDSSINEVVPVENTPSASSSSKIPREDKEDIEKSTEPTPLIKISSVQRSGDIIQIRTQIPSITNQGSCSLNITNGDKTYSASADVQALPNSSTCKGFNVPVSSLPAGIWLIKASYIKDNGTSVDTREFQV